MSIHKNMRRSWSCIETHTYYYKKLHPSCLHNHQFHHKSDYLPHSACCSKVCGPFCSSCYLWWVWWEIAKGIFYSVKTWPSHGPLFASSFFYIHLLPWLQALKSHVHFIKCSGGWSLLSPTPKRQNHSPQYCIFSSDLSLQWAIPSQVSW